MSKNWKDTLLMPKTNFEMKANLVTKEPLFRNFWKKNDIYKKSLENNQNNQAFRLHDGPPYANGSLHLGHAFNKILKDIVIRNKILNGFYCPFVFGWDTHGLPIENKMLEELKMTKDDLNPLELRKYATKYALKQIEIQASQFEKMQLFANLENRYVTLDKEFEVEQLKLFKKLIMDKIIFKGLKPIYWSPSSQSALAEAEIEYKDYVSPQIIVAFKVKNGNNKIKKGDNLLIMTTTPWTLIANSGVAVGKKFQYDIVINKGKRYVIATKLVSNVAKLCKWSNYEIFETINGSQIVGVDYIRPIFKDKIGPVVIGKHVTIETGTGLVHLAPLFGEDDYIIAKNEDLELIMHVDKKGNFNEEAKNYKGKFYIDANKDIGIFLEKKGELLSLKFLKHSYPFDWRTHKPVIYRGTPQWFVSIKEIKKNILNSLKKIKTFPWWGAERLSKMIETRNEWTISRQRTWGVPIIIFYDQNGKPVIEEEIFDYVIELVSKYGTNIWWERKTDQLLPKKFRNKNFTREMDIMDVWFDSGISHLIPQTRGENINMKDDQYDLYLEGSDQYRGWFNTSLITAIAYLNRAPFKSFVSHGFVLDGKQQKMSKSKGNIIDPLEIIEKNGVGILRLWTANSEFTSDVSISNEILNQNVEIYRRIRNSIKFMLGNLFDFDESKKVEKLKGFHLWVNEKIQNFKKEINDSYKNYKFINIVKNINNLLIELSSFYFEYNKDNLYVENANSTERRMVQTNIFNLLDFLLKAIAPILPTTAEEAYKEFNKKNKKESIFLEKILDKGHNSKLIQNKWKDFFDLKNKIYKLLEDAKKNQLIKRSNEAFLTLKVDSDFIKSLDLKKLLMVGKINFGDENKVEKFDSKKCERCWNHFEKNILNKENICARCEKVIS